eukprot:CAMPEP_0116860944 /NCGR_PEP_ID=MMETSP0418-20121206/22730_1 /TAXON_ID=1158023 /ORGANISM="Astrosyne radiata, Strain 13vi08-1A" /LENGTH=422 /DNA_ID=CAMNT_0004495475 /DNA_START=1081 /DNA_END=2350 /DNA_ORIENTATION=+
MPSKKRNARVAKTAARPVFAISVPLARWPDTLLTLTLTLEPAVPRMASPKGFYLLSRKKYSDCYGVDKKKFPVSIRDVAWFQPIPGTTQWAISATALHEKQEECSHSRVSPGWRWESVGSDPTTRLTHVNGRRQIMTMESTPDTPNTPGTPENQAPNKEVDPLVPEDESKPDNGTSLVVEVVASSIIFVVGVCCFAFDIPPRERPIPFQELQSDQAVLSLILDEKLQKETVSDGLLGIIMGVCAAVQFSLAQFFYPEDRLKTVCVYFISVGLVMIATETVKSYIGYLRPYTYEGCQPSTEFLCTAKDDDFRKSFPSGHASLGFNVCVLLSLYIGHRFGVGSARHVVRETPEGDVLFQVTPPTTIQRAFSLVSLGPIAVAIFIAASRVVNNYHFPADIVGGALLGYSISVFSHGLWFPSLPTE